MNPYYFNLPRPEAQEGERYIVLCDIPDDGLKQGDIVMLSENDNTTNPWFETRFGKTEAIHWPNLAPENHKFATNGDGSIATVKPFKIYKG